MQTFQQSFLDYLSLEKKCSAHTITAYIHDVEEFSAFITEMDREAEIDKIVYGNVREWIVALSDKKLTNNAINRKISSLKTFYKFLVRSRQIESSPLLKHKSLKTPKKVQVPFSPVEMNKVLDEVEYEDSFKGIRNRCIIEIFYSSGMRRAELIGLELSNVSFDENTIKVLGKGNKQRIIPILPIVVKNIERYLPYRAEVVALDEQHLFVTKRGVKLNETFVYRLINGYFSTVSEKVKKSPHILRHSFATHLLNNGADINSVKELLGHSSLASTQIYTQSSLAELKRVYGSAHPRTNEQ